MVLPIDLANATAVKSKVVAKGVRVGMLYMPSAMLKMEVQDSKGTSDTKPTLGATVGYQMISEKNIGFVAGLNYLPTSYGYGDEAIHVNIATLEGNIAYAPADDLYLRAGLNVSKIISADGIVKSSEIRSGQQVGMGLQFTPEYAAELTYMRIKQDGELDDQTDAVANNIGYDAIAEGFAVGLIGTF